MPNRLINETSPYLLQHAHNPVDWYPWGPEALERARVEDRPIFLSVGYSACHWCHVMAHESFEDPATAAVMNELYVNIKVDREERPDVDAIYMQAVVALAGRGGWPMSVFLTPQGVPFFGGTYYPPESRHGLPSFQQLLRAVHAAWRDRRAEVVAQSQSLLQHLRSAEALGLPAGGALDPSVVTAAVRTLSTQFDPRSAGWGGAPKFPQPMTLEFLLRYQQLTGESAPLEMVTRTLQSMARGGMYDQLGGGFHRYSTDARWLVPHFEKMLYDNAQLARVYLHAFQATGEPEFRRVAEEVLDYVRREMTDPGGGFYSAQDADSEGEEGRFFVWSEAEIDSALGADAALFKAAHGVQPGGNFEGRSILFRAEADADLAQRFSMDRVEIEQRLHGARRRLFDLRERRVKPGLDDKVLTAWNGLMLAAFAEAGPALGREDYLLAARANADFLLGSLRTPAGRLLRTWRRGEARLNAYLEDYACAAEGLLAAYQATFEPHYFTAARELMDQALEHFADPQGGFFDTSDDHETLVTRPKDLQDNATPSGSAMAATVLLKLGALTGEARYTRTAEAVLRSVQPVLDHYPTGFAQWLCALAFACASPREIALVGDPDAPEMRALLDVASRPYRPFQVLALGRPGEAPVVPLLRDRPAHGPAAAYVCQNLTCQMPVTTPEALRAQLEGSAR